MYLEEFVQRYGHPATVPPATFLFICEDDTDDLELVVSEFWRWLKSEQAVVMAAKTLYEAGHGDHAAVLLEAMELATAFAQQHIEKAETRASAFERLTLGTAGRVPYEDYQRHNANIYRPAYTKYEESLESKDRFHTSKGAVCLPYETPPTPCCETSA